MRAGTEGSMTMPPPKISVIMPTHNRPDLLAQAVTSVLSQTEAEFELLVINDGGVDVKDALSPLDDPRIHLLNHPERRGQAAARNTGLKAARGDYIAFLDDDDLYYPQHLEVLSRAAARTGVAYADAWRVFIDENGRETGRDVPFRHDFDRDLLLVTNYIPLPCLMHKRSCLEKTGLFDEELNSLEDWDLIIRLSRQHDFTHISEFTAEYRKFKGSASVTKTGMEQSLAITEKIHALYRRYADEETLAAQKRRVALLQIKLGGESSYSIAELSAQLISDGENCFNAGDLNRAIFFFRNALELEPSNPEALTDLGVALWQQGCPAEATEKFIRVLETDPTHPDALFNLLNCLEQQLNVSISSRLIEKIVSCGTDNELLARLCDFKEKS